MKRIASSDIHDMNDVIMELPAFSELKSKDNIHEVLDLFMKSVYIKQPKEIFDAMDFELNTRMQETFFTNYGIDKKYSDKLKGYLKKDIAYQLEHLFQNKGSRTIFRIFSDLFESVFRNINFYNVKVFKIPTSTGFRFEYQLVPLYITDTDNILKYPQIPIEQSRKYLMDLENFQDYTMWPMPTNLVYIQLSIGEELINNMDVFLNGIRAYGTTYLQGKQYNYKSKHGYIEKIHADDLEFIIEYFKIELTKKDNPDWNFNSTVGSASYLPYDSNLNLTPGDQGYAESLQWTESRIDFLKNMQELLLDYGEADRRNRAEMESLRRRWQFFLRLKEKQNQCYHDYDSLVEAMSSKYPLIQEDFLSYLDMQVEDTEPLFDFYIYIYSIFLNGTMSNPEDPSLGLNEEWTIDYIDVLFGSLFVEADFLKWYFNPVMDLFIRYFFPIEMEYINDLVPKILIRDKWNSVSYEETNTFMIKAGQLSLLPMPKNRLGRQSFDIDILGKISFVEKRSIPGTRISTKQLSDQLPERLNDRPSSIPFRRHQDKLDLNDTFDARITQNGTFVQRTSGCLSTTGTKDYRTDLAEILSTYINNTNLT